MKSAVKNDRKNLLRALAYQTEEEQVLKTPGMWFLESPLDDKKELEKLFPPYLRLLGGIRFTVITGKFATGQSTWTKVIRRLWPDVGYLPETTNRSPREGEQNGEYHRFVSTEEFHRLRKAGKLLFPRCRWRGGKAKLTALAVEDVMKALLAQRPCLANFNVLTLMRLDDLFHPPIPCIITCATDEDHRVFQLMRGLPKDDAGKSGIYGLPLPRRPRVAGVVPLQSELVAGLEDLKESERQEKVIQESLCRLKNPPTPLERELISAPDTSLSREEILRHILFRQDASEDVFQKEAWRWLIEERILRESGESVA